MKTSRLSSRITAIDALRGSVMIVMALDHVRDFVHRGAMSGSPTNFAQTTPALFLTRWITHFCAPSFMFAAGLGAFLWWQRSKTRGELSRFLLTRGVWLVFLELTVMRLALDFRISSSDPILLEVMWALGMSMIALAALVWLPERVLAALCILMIVLHNTLDSIQPAQFGAAAPLWNILHQSGFFKLGGVQVLLAYPLIPWIAVMGAGFCFGRVFLMNAETRIRTLFVTGAAATLAFLILRTINLYGDPFRWSARKWPLLSFLNTTKYPPSLDFLLMTLGPALLALACFERWPLRVANPIVIFGRVPLFFFVMHFYAGHLAMVFLAWFKYGSASFMFQPEPSVGGPAQAFPPGFGFDLWVVYAVWAAVVIACYPACRWFADVKARRRDWWLSYL